MKMIFILAFFVVIIYQTNLLADQIYGGVSLFTRPGQPDFVPDANITFALSTKAKGLENWRFSYSLANSRHTDDTSNTIQSHILSAETVSILDLAANVRIFWAVGPAFFMTSVDTTDTYSAYNAGLSATASLLYELTDTLFISGSLMYKNCALHVDGNVVDAGFNGLFFNFGGEF